MKRTLLVSTMLVFGFAFGQAQSSMMDRLEIRKSKNDKLEVKVFPNPVTNYMEVTEGAKVGKLVVFNLVGREMKRFEVEDGESYFVGDLPNGMYLVQILDEKDKIMTTQRISKR